MKQDMSRLSRVPADVAYGIQRRPNIHQSNAPREKADEDSSEVDEEEPEGDEEEPEGDVPPLRRSGRNRQPPVWYNGRSMNGLFIGWEDCRAT